MTLIDASTMFFGWIRRRCLTSLLCSFDNGGTSSICARMVRNCAMTSSGAILAGSGFDETGVVLLMIFLHYASCQAGGDVTTRRQVRAATGWKFRPRADSSG